MRLSSAILGFLTVVLLTGACIARPAREDVLILRGTEDGQVQAMVAKLAAELPVALPVLVREVPGLLQGSSRLGYARVMPGFYEIGLEAELSPLEQSMVLVHEWAHLLVWDRGTEHEDSHGPEWGEALSEVFRAWVE